MDMEPLAIRGRAMKGFALERCWLNESPLALTLP
jgi:hypothetical protein